MHELTCLLFALGSACARVQGYSAVITRPMDYSTISANVRALRYKDPLAFRDDIEQIVYNAVKFNTPHDMVYEEAWRVQKAAATWLKRTFGLAEVLVCSHPYPYLLM